MLDEHRIGDVVVREHDGVRACFDAFRSLPQDGGRRVLVDSERQFRIDVAAFGERFEGEFGQFVAEVSPVRATAAEADVVARAEMLRIEFIEEEFNELLRLVTREATCGYVVAVEVDVKLVERPLRTDILAFDLLHLVVDEGKL